MKILAFAGSSSKHSINKQLATYVAKKFPSSEVNILDLNDYEMPLFSVDLEAKLGPQQKAQILLEKIKNCEVIVLSLAEHNGSYSVAFKNVLDWTTRIEKNLFQNKPMFLLATSPGLRGARTVLEAAKISFPLFGAQIKASFSLPEFSKNFEPSIGVVNESLKNELLALIKKF